METLHTVLYKKNYFHIFLFRSTIIPQFLFHFRGWRRIFPSNGVLFTQEILNEIILLCMDYDIALRLEKTGGLKKEVISLKLQNFSFFNTSFEITQKLFQIRFTPL